VHQDTYPGLAGSKRAGGEHARLEPIDPPVPGTGLEQTCPYAFTRRTGSRTTIAGVTCEALRESRAPYASSPQPVARGVVLGAMSTAYGVTPGPVASLIRTTALGARPRLLGVASTSV
jgi:hypothetical protein